MAEYTSVALQEVATGQNVVFTETPVRCNRGYVLHRDGSGIFTLRGITEQCRARYKVSFGANIAVPAGGTVAPISVAVAVEGEALGSATAIVTPAAAEEFGNVFTAVYIEVPRGCCLSVAVRNTSEEAINVQNANLIVERVA